MNANGHRQVVGNGRMPSRTLISGVSPVEVCQRVHALRLVGFGDEVARGRPDSLVNKHRWRRYVRRFAEAGYFVEHEAERNGRADVLATKADRTVGIAIETGKSDVTWNLEHWLHVGVDEIPMVTTNGGGLPKVERNPWAGVVD